MPPPRAHARLSFQAKVLIPVVIVMILLVAATILFVNLRITKQFQAEASQKLSEADTVFNHSQKLRAKNLWLRYRNIPNDPRFKAVSQKGDPDTLRYHLRELLAEFGGEVVFFTTERGRHLAQASLDSEFQIAQFQERSFDLVKRALDDQPTVHALLFGNRLFDVVSIPVKVGVNVVGALTFGVEIGATVAEEFKQLTHMEIVFLVNDRVTLTTLQKQGLQRDLREHFLDTELPKKPRVRELSLGGEHFVGLGAPFTAMGDGEPAYLLLSSYEQSLAALHATQRMLALCSLVAIALGTGVVFLLVRKVTQPLRALRDSAEAVGHGDFSRRVEVASRDECGELANVFNEMTDKLKVSRTQLERTVDTLKTTQAQLVQSEKLSAIGEFVAGVAHELNNPLTSVIGFAELLQNADVSDRHKHFLGLIMISAHRCHKIVQSLLSFARQHKPERKLVQLREVIESAMSILQYQLRTNNVEVQTQFAADSPKVMGDPHQLQQVFINILNNARQAIEAYRPRGLVRITTEVHNSTVRVTFQDDGPGIETDNISRIFNPFFTTKEIGQGTGLGLSLSYGIIKEHGGNISVQSKPGEGATFIIELPVAQESDGHAKKAEERNTTVFDGRGKKVLVVDDEELVLNLVSESLNPTGCDLAVAADGESALRQLRETRFDLTICDWKMPGVNGQQVYEALRTLDRDAASRFIFMTGDVMSSNVQSFLEQTGVTCLSKPFSIDHFRSVVGKVLKAA